MPEDAANVHSADAAAGDVKGLESSSVGQRPAISEDAAESIQRPAPLLQETDHENPVRVEPKHEDGNAPGDPARLTRLRAKQEASDEVVTIHKKIDEVEIASDVGDTDRTPTPSTVRQEPPPTKSERPLSPDADEQNELFPNQESRRQLELRAQHIIAGEGRACVASTPADDSDLRATRAPDASGDTADGCLQGDLPDETGVHGNGGDGELLKPVEESATDFEATTEHAADQAARETSPAPTSPVTKSWPQAWPMSPAPTRPTTSPHAKPSNRTQSLSPCGRQSPNQQRQGRQQESEAESVFVFSAALAEASASAGKDFDVDCSEAITADAEALAADHEGRQDPWGTEAATACKEQDGPGVDWAEWADRKLCGRLVDEVQQMQELIERQYQQQDRWNGKRQKVVDQLELLRSQQRVLAACLRSEFLECQRLRQVIHTMSHETSETVEELYQRMHEESEQQLPLLEELTGARLLEAQLRTQWEEETSLTWRFTADVGRHVSENAPRTPLMPTPGALLDIVATGTLDASSRLTESAGSIARAVADVPVEGTENAAALEHAKRAVSVGLAAAAASPRLKKGVEAAVAAGSVRQEDTASGAAPAWLAGMGASKEQVRLQQRCAQHTQQLAELVKEVALETTKCACLDMEIEDVAARVASSKVQPRRLRAAQPQAATPIAENVSSDRAATGAGGGGGAAAGPGIGVSEAAAVATPTRVEDVVLQLDGAMLAAATPQQDASADSQLLSIITQCEKAASSQITMSCAAPGAAATHIGEAETVHQQLEFSKQERMRVLQQENVAMQQFQAQEEGFQALKLQLEHSQAEQVDLESRIAEAHLQVEEFQGGLEKETAVLDVEEKQSCTNRDTARSQLASTIAELRREQDEVNELTEKLRDPAGWKKRQRQKHLEHPRLCEDTATSGDGKALLGKAPVKRQYVLAKEDSDPWGVTMPPDDLAWTDRTCPEKFCLVSYKVLKCCAALILFYAFAVSLSLLGSALTILGGHSMGALFRNAHLVDDPIAGLVLGALTTVMVQSSTTSTSIIVTLTAAGVVELKNAIPMVMGVNIGDSITTAIVSIAHLGNRQEYRRAFAGAAIHGCFNLLVVVILLPLEMLTGMLREISIAIVSTMDFSGDSRKVNFLRELTNPVTSGVISLDFGLISQVATAEQDGMLRDLRQRSIIAQNATTTTHLFLDTPMNDVLAGVLLLITSLTLLFTTLALLVNVLKSVLTGDLWVKANDFFNLEFKRVRCVGDYVLLLFGVIVAFLMQSGGLAISVLILFCGIGLIRIDKMFPLTVGANLGATVTEILAALASDNVKVGMEVAFSHLLFNVFGMVLWLPSLPLARVPVQMAKTLGTLAARLRCFPFAYIVFVVAAAPCTMLLVSAFAGLEAIIMFLIFMSMIIIAAAVVMALLITTAGWEDGVRAEVAEDAVRDGRDSWPQASIVVAFTLLTVAGLALAVPNVQWASLRYAKSDGRHHVGIGPFQACSEMYLVDMPWTVQWPHCTNAKLEACNELTLSSACQNNSMFATEPGANAIYQASWQNCESSCSPSEWGAYCQRIACSGMDSPEAHAQQCHNVTVAAEISTKSLVTSYGEQGTNAWTAGDRCRSVGELCDNSMTLTFAGWGAYIGSFLVLAAIIPILLQRYPQFCERCSCKRRLNLFWVTVMILVLAWIYLGLGWLLFYAVLQNETTCVVAHASGTGAVALTGPFKDIVGGEGGYSFHVFTACWVIESMVIILVVCTRPRSEERQQPSGDQVEGTQELVDAADPLAVGRRRTI